MADLRWKDQGGGTEGTYVEGPTWRDLGQHTGGPYVEGFKWRGLGGGTYAEWRDLWRDQGGGA